MKIVSVRDISKKYNTVQALEQVRFDVEEGEIFGLTGPDGAGKTTLFRILTTLVLADTGVAQVNQLDVVKDYKQIRKQIGYMPGRFSLYQDLTVEENLRFFATIFHTTIAENYELIKDIYQQIEPFKKRKAGKLSGGMKQKLALSCALIHKPVVLFLDEPTTGVDSVSRKEFWQMLYQLKKRGITILVSTPYMDEATLCDRIALMQDGTILQLDTPSGIIDRYRGMLWKVRSDRMFVLLNDLRKYDAIETSFTFGEFHHITVRSDLRISELNHYLVQKGHTGIQIEPIKATIEDCFMQLTPKTVI